MVRPLSARRHALAACACLFVNSVALCQESSEKQRADPPVDPRTPAKLLLPPTPKAVGKLGPLLRDDLAMVPEVSFHEPFVAARTDTKGFNESNLRLLHAKLRILDGRKGDAFVAGVQSNRADVAGLPFLRGDSCRLNPERSAIFPAVLATIRNHADSEVFFAAAYLESTKAEETGFAASGVSLEQDVIPARVAGLMQILGPKPDMHAGLVGCLTGLAHRDGTKALARIALFSADDKARAVALKVLGTRREKDYDDLIRQALRYPYLPVAKRATEALVKLDRADWLPELIDFLEEPDPRMPSGGGDKPWTVRELVRVNHNRNCLLCHAPAQGSSDPCTAPVHIPVFVPCGNLKSGGYGIVTPDPSAIFVRFDITYLRQDFSTIENCERFDYLVRTRKLSPAEAKSYERALTPTQPGTPSPYQRAVLAALRDLTGRDAAPTAAAWRALLKIDGRR